MQIHNSRRKINHSDETSAFSARQQKPSIQLMQANALLKSRAAALKSITQRALSVFSLVYSNLESWDECLDRRLCDWPPGVVSCVTAPCEKAKAPDDTWVQGLNSKPEIRQTGVRFISVTRTQYRRGHITSGTELKNIHVQTRSVDIKHKLKLSLDLHEMAKSFWTVN